MINSWVKYCLMIVVVAIAVPSFFIVSPDAAVKLPEPAFNQPLNYRVSSGAAPGYVEDKTCGRCHSDIYQSYQHVGMAKSFTTPSRDKFVEDFNQGAFFHQPSQRYYQVVKAGDELLFQRWQLDEKGKRINEFERKIDFILGSGHKTRAYLYREPGGEMYQLPIGWYTQDNEWGMSPGYDNAQHQGVTRAVQRQCMFCHNAFPQVEKGSDQHWQPHVFPAELPQGTGCQRCHGPGAKHVETVLKGATNVEQIHGSIVNPAKLPADKRDSVCFQCHMLPSVDLTGPRNFGRSDYSFRPGEDINDYMHHVDVIDAKVDKAKRFEINHHAYRLRQSLCFSKSEGALSCISCHNPHKKVPVEQRAEHYAKVCQNCHEAQVHKPPLIENTDCVSCHMPQRRTQDVVKVVMTDHKIQRFADKDRLKPLKEEEPVLQELDFLNPDKSPKGDMGQIYKVITMLRVAPSDNYVDYLHSMLAKVNPTELQPYMDLAQGQLMLKRYQAAEKLTRWLLQKAPDNFMVKQWLATALLGQGKLEEAKLIFKSLLAQNPQLAELHFNYGLLLKGQGEHKSALASFERAIALRASFVLAWFHRAEIKQVQSQSKMAIDYYKETLSIDPGMTRAYIGLADALIEMGKKAEAIRYLKHGQKVARQKESIKTYLSKLSS